MRTIFVGVDGSEASLHAARWAVDHAALDDAEVHLVHVYRHRDAEGEAAGMIGAPLGTGADRDALAREHAMMLLSSAREGLAASGTGASGTHVSLHAEEGLAAPALIEASEDADLLVLGSRGRGGFAGLLLGSVSQQCAVHARCPVVIVPRDR